MVNPGFINCVSIFSKWLHVSYFLISCDASLLLACLCPVSKWCTQHAQTFWSPGFKINSQWISVISAISFREYHAFVCLFFFCLLCWVFSCTDIVKIMWWLSSLNWCLIASSHERIQSSWYVSNLQWWGASDLKFMTYQTLSSITSNRSTWISNHEHSSYFAWIL